MKIVEGYEFLIFDSASTVYTKYMQYLILFEAACLIEMDMCTKTIRFYMHSHSTDTELVYYCSLGGLLM